MLGMDKQMLLSLLEVPSCVQAPQGDDASASMRPGAEVLAPVDDLSSERMVIASENCATSDPEESKMEAAAGSDGGSFRHYRKVILIPALLAAFAGWLVSYACIPRYTSKSLVLVDAQRAPEDIVHPVVTTDLTERLAILQQTVLSESRLRSMLERSGLAQPGQEMGDLIDKIRTDMSVEPVEIDRSEFGAARDKASNQNSPVPGFYVTYTASTAHEGQQICNELTSLMLEENLKSRQDVARGAIDFLNRELDDTRRNLEALDAQFLERSKGHDSRSSESEKKYTMLVLEHEIEKKSYTDLLSKLSGAQGAAKLAKDAEDQQLGEQMRLLNPASLPDAPEFPNRLLFAVGGLIAALVFGIGLALWLRYRPATVRIAPIPTTL
jgi:uncharacterized protein involved in exopolysaccharide biosynthesis